MKKLVIIEVCVLIALIIAAAVMWFMPMEPAISAGDLSMDTTASYTETLVTQQTEVPGPTWNVYPEDRQLLAQQYFVYDCKENTFLITSGQAEERIYPASITKLFTAYVAMQYVSPETEITAGGALDLVAWGSSVAKIQKGDVLTGEQLVEAMILPSGNDAAYILACQAGRMIKNDPQLGASAAVDAFMEEMNRQAQDVGMTGTHFVNPDGIHDKNHYTTFADLVILGKLAIADATIMRYAATPEEEVALHGETILWKNTNRLINPANPYYCPYAIGLKTGQTPSAGSCLLSAFRTEDKELLIGVFGCPEETDRFDDTLQLFNQIVLK